MTNETKHVSERIVEYLESIDDAARPREIAEEVDASVNYTRQVCNNLHDEGIIEKHHGSPIIGHPMPDGGSVVLPADKARLLELVRKYDPGLLDQAKDLNPPNLRTLIESEIAVGEPHPMGNRKVSFGIGDG